MGSARCGSVEAQAIELARSSGEWYWDDMAESRRESWRQIIRDAQKVGREASRAALDQEDAK